MLQQLLKKLRYCLKNLKSKNKQTLFLKKHFTMNFFKIFSIIALAFTSLSVTSQTHLHTHNGFVRCATVEYDQIRRNQHPEIGTKLEFEAWISQEIRQFKQQKANNRLPVLTIPVVVHVIHNGDAVGSGENISTAQVLSQIQVLNEDFRKMMGSPGHNTNPVGADVEIEFCMAVVDPNGNSTNGVDRVNLGQVSWDQSGIESTLKPQTIWDPTQYLNMWTCRFGGSSSSLLGYAQFPDASGLSGLPSSGGGANTDGIIINYNAFGTSAVDDGSFNLNPTYNLGRTVTHELGHWLGLRHIWGDGPCGQDDFCNDTPLAGAANYGCQAGAASCGSQDMIENYMDYSDDACMNIFTEDQKTRIRTVLSNSPRRASLATSTVCSNNNAPPVCSITPSTTSVVAGNSVNFTDGTTGSPSSWNWNFDNTSLGGVTPTTSTTQNPTGITYNTVGTYQVQLTATNANGTCTSTASINVVLSSGCDTIDNFVATDSLAIYESNQASQGNPFGYIAGWNNYGDISKAEYFNGYNPYTHVTGVDVYFYGVYDGGNGATVDFNIWSENSGQPNTILGTATATLLQLDNALNSNGGQGVLHVTFPSVVNVGGSPFYCGITMNGFTPTDSLGIVTSTIHTPSNSGWEQWSDNTWHAYSEQASWDMNLTHYITPYVTDMPVSGTITATPNTSCPGSPITFNATGVNASAYSWYFPSADNENTTGTSTTATYSTPGNYTAYLFIDGTCDGSYIDSLPITITAGPTINSVIATPSCTGNDGQITINVSNGSTPYQYSIDGGSTFQSSNLFSNLIGGSYNIVVTDASGCSSIETATVPIGTGVLSVTSTTSDPTCNANDGSIVVNATGGSTPYTFSNDNGSTFNAGTAPYTFNNLAIGTYNLIVKDVNGCQGFETVTLVNTSAPTLTTNTVHISCNGANDGQLYNSATGGSYPYQYSIDGTNFQPSGIFGGLSSGTYNITIQDANGCSSVGTAQINEGGSVTHTATTNDASCGVNNGNISIIPTGGTTPYQYSIDGGSTFQTNGFFNSLAGGTYNVVTVDANGCSSTVSSETIQGSGIFSVAAANTGETCMDSNATITVTESGGTSPFQYSIDNGLNFQNTGTFTGLSANNYNIVILDANGCQTSTSETVVNQGGFTLSVTPDQTICNGNTATITAGGAGSGASYSWDNGLNGGTVQIVTPTTTTTYTVIANDTQGCSRTGTTTVTVNQIPTVTVTPNNPTICSGDSIDLVASGAQNYTWNTGVTTGTIKVAPTSQTQYVVIGANGNCNSSPVSLMINVDPAPTVVANGSPVSVAVGGTVNFNNNNSVATSYDWNFGDGTTSNQGAVSHTFSVDGTYDVVLTGYLGNCDATDTITIIVGNGGPTGITTNNLDHAFNIYPNPSNGILNIAIDLPYFQNVEILTYDAVGKLIKTKKLENILKHEITLDLSSSAKGTYFIKINTDLGQITRRITILK